MSTLYQRPCRTRVAIAGTFGSGGIQTSSKNIKRDQEVDREVFGFTLHQTQALIGKAEGFQFLKLSSAHLYFPKFFPSTPIEASLVHPVFHPNVQPGKRLCLSLESVLLWRHSHGSSQPTPAGHNLEAGKSGRDHLMQPDALAWYKDPGPRNGNSPSPTNDL